MNLYKVGIICVAIAAMCSACESKFSESSPDSVKIKGLPLDERMSQKEKIDARIEEVQKGADKAKKIIEMFKKIQNPSAQEDVYTPFDFIVDLNNELKSKIPENSGGKLVRYGKIEVPVQGLSEECRIIETLLESDTISDKDLEPKQPVGEKLTYSLKTCGSEGKFIEALVAEWIGTTLEIKVINKNLETIFNDFVLAGTMNSSTCKIKQGQKKIIDTISCENFDVRLSSSEKAHIKNMTFRNSDEVRFESLADVLENGKLKATSDIKIFSNGEVKFNLKKVDHAAGSSLPQ
jgi:hypothetical protein